MANTIFVVDDSDTNLAMAEKALEDHYRVMTMPSAVKMFSLIEKISPDLILLDIEMPEMDGFDALQRLKAHPLYADIPVIFLTGRTDDSIEARGLELGAVDFITKPFSMPVLLNRVKMHMRISVNIRSQTVRLRRLQSGIIFVLANMVESRDKTTGCHIEHTSEYIKILINAMAIFGVYTSEIRDWDLETTVSSARLHDVGKIVVSDLLLNKPAKLTAEEYEEIKTHASAGERIIDQIAAFSGSDAAFLRNARLFAGCHHEHWDGTGYPYGLKGTEIPLQGRIMAIADVYDALVSVRPYKDAYTDEEAVSIIMAETGKLFDPKITEVFFKVRDMFTAVRIGF